MNYFSVDGADTSVGSIDAIDVQPFPVEIKTGSTVTISATLSLLAEVPAGAKVALNIVKEGIVDLPLPCLEIDGLHVGSCEYTADYLLEKFSGFLCPDHVPAGQTCATPLMPGTYGGDPPITMEIPEIPEIIASLLASGTFYADATIMYPDGTQMTCLYVRIEVVA